MHHSIAAVLVLAVSCISAFPVLFLSYEDDGSQDQRVLECVTQNPHLRKGKKGLSYRCRQSKVSLDSFGVKLSDLAVFEILDEPLNDVMAVDDGDDDISFRPIASAVESASFGTSKVVVKNGDATNANTKYEVVPEPKTTKKRNQGGCADDEVFVGELDLCMPFTPEDSHITSTVIDDVDPVAIIPDFKILSVSYSPTECPKGEMYLPSVGICAPANNCWPYPSCDHYKEKEKEKNKDKATRTEVEDDD